MRLSLDLLSPNQLSGRSFFLSFPKCCGTDYLTSCSAVVEENVKQTVRNLAADEVVRSVSFWLRRFVMAVTDSTLQSWAKWIDANPPISSEDLNSTSTPSSTSPFFHEAAVDVKTERQICAPRLGRK